MNPRIDESNSLTPQRVTSTVDHLSGDCQDFMHADWLDLAAIDPTLREIMEAWPQLSDSEREHFKVMLVVFRKGKADYTIHALGPIAEASRSREVRPAGSD